MKIDSHQHFWKYNEADYGWMGPDMEKLRRDHLPDELGTILKSVGFDGSVAVQARQIPEETEWLLTLAAEHAIIKGVAGWVDLRSENVDVQLEHFAANDKLKGVRHVLQDEEDDRFMLGDDFVRGISRLEKFGLVYDILIFPRHVKYAVELVAKFPNQRFVVDHIAKPFIKKGEIEPWKADMQQLAGAENVWCKVSGMVTEAAWDGWKRRDFRPYMAAVLEMFGVDRLMFGSDWPVCTVAAEYRQVLEIVADFVASLSEDEQSKIMGSNAVDFYKLKD